MALDYSPEFCIDKYIYMLGCHCSNYLNCTCQVSRTRGYRTFFMLNSTEHEISTPYKNYNAEK